MSHLYKNNAKVSGSPFFNLQIIKLLLITTFLLTLLLSAVYFYLLKSQFEQQLANSQADDKNLLTLLMNQSDQQLIQSQNFISSINELKKAVKQQNHQKAIKSFDKHWPDFQTVNKVDFVGFYDLSGNTVAQWPTDENHHDNFKLQQNWINEVKLTSQNFFTVICNEQCKRYLISPLSINKSIIGYQLIAIPMNKIRRQLEAGKNRITGILLASDKTAPSASSLLLNQYWMNANTIPLAQYYILKGFSKFIPDVVNQQAVFKATINEVPYSLSLYPLGLSDNSLLFILDDLSDQFHRLSIKTLKFAALTALIVFAMQILLLLNLKWFYLKNKIPVQKKINKTTTWLPQKPPAKTSQEILELNYSNQQRALVMKIESEVQLSSQLNSLKKYIGEVNQELAQQRISLDHERSLVNNILNNSQDIIMLLHQDGSIANLNSRAEEITGLSKNGLAGKNFIDLYPEKESVALKDLEKLSSLNDGTLIQYKHEARLKRSDGQESIILWLHTKLHNIKDPQVSILSTGIDITQQKNLENHINWLVNHDSLTSLYNRHRFEKELDTALNWASIYKSDGCLLSIDLDNFQDINDSFGHKVGDNILRKVAKTLKEITLKIDVSAKAFVARLGSDEFAILLRNIDEEGSILLSRKIINALNNITNLHQQISFNLSSSIGIATFSLANNNPTELLSNANFARNQSKIDGRNQFHVFRIEYSHLEKTHHRMIWCERIESALKNNRFILYFQPIMSIKHYKISHYETLIRMLDENDEVILPGSFISIAEKFGLIQKIDNFIIDAAIAKQGELRRQGNDVTLTINLSAKSFDDAELFNRIDQTIKQHKANPHHLIFEITETGAVSNITTAEKTMRKIMSLGCQFALDDFGIGFSSFQYLRKLPVDYVKIDGSFVIDLANNSDNKVLVQALSEVAIGFNKLTIAEFVDSRQTLEILREAKINYAQGFYIGRPCATIPVELADTKRYTSIH